jgi:tetratricopeptide (TPR) repeat protein
MDLDMDVYYPQAHAALQKALALASKAPEHERAYVEALSRRLSADPKPDAAKLALAYIDAMRELHRRYPDDLDAATLYAEALMVPHRWNWWTPDGKPNLYTEEAARVLEGVMQREPNHPGANHLYVHVVEMDPDKQRGIASAQRLMANPPATGHLVHMAGHIFLQTGDYDLVARSNEHAVQMDRGYMHLTGVTTGAYAFGYYPHNIHFIVVARMNQGRFEDAWRAAKELEASALPAVDAMPEMPDYFVPNTLFVLLRFHKWDQILATPAPPPKLLTTRALWRFARALAFAATGRRAEALAEHKHFEAARQAVPPEYPFTVNSARRLLEIPAAILEARLAPGAASSLDPWRRAVAAQDALNYDEPPPWFYPVRESLGAALLRAGRPGEAETVFREGLRRTPRSGRLLFGLLEALKAQNKSAAARSVQVEFDRAWKQATVSLRLEDL